MGLLDKFFGRKTGTPGKTCDARARDPEQMYKLALDLFGREKFRDAAEILEETVSLNPNSAPVHFTLGITYSRIIGECGADDDKVRPWATKSMDCFKKAVELASKFGGLNEKQLSIARDAATAFDRIKEKEFPSLPEDQRRKIFADFMETHDTEYLLGTDIEELRAASSMGSPRAMMQVLNRHGAQADAATYAKIGRKYGIREGQLQAIVQEGKEKKWPFRAVAR
jgi:hypothetical protein